LSDLPGLGGRGVRQKGGEFVAAEAIQAIVGAQRHHQCIGDDGEYAVALGMTVSVVDGLEPVAIEQQESHTLRRGFQLAAEIFQSSS